MVSGFWTLLIEFLVSSLLIFN